LEHLSFNITIYNNKGTQRTSSVTRHLTFRFRLITRNTYSIQNQHKNYQLKLCLCPFKRVLLSSSGKYTRNEKHKTKQKTNKQTNNH
jgi:hypothetical protein